MNCVFGVHSYLREEIVFKNVLQAHANHRFHALCFLSGFSASISDRYLLHIFRHSFLISSLPFCAPCSNISSSRFVFSVCIVGYLSDEIEAFTSL